MDFRLVNNIPNVYVEESRDFQLLCRILDIYLKGLLEKSATVPYILDVDKCDESLLWLIANMQGFTTKKYIPPRVLRNICRVFPYCIRRKGTEEAIRVAAYAVLSVDRLVYSISLSPGDTSSPSTWVITCNTRSAYFQYLEEVLTFILPTGCSVVYREATVIPVTKESKVDIRSSFTRWSGITSRIIKSEPSVLQESQGTWAPMSNTMYSRIGAVKILTADNADDIFTRKVSGFMTGGGSEVTLIQNNTPEAGQDTSTFIGQNITKQEN